MFHEILDPRSSTVDRDCWPEQWWWLERRTLTQSRDSWRVKAEELERATVPYTYSGGSTLGGFYQETIRIPIVPDELQRALTRAEEAEAESRQRRIVEAKL